MRRLILFGLAGGGITMLAATVAVFVFILLLVKVLWAWTVPDLFPGAVTQGLVAREIGWLTAVKLSIFVVVLAGIAGARKQK